MENSHVTDEEEKHAGDGRLTRCVRQERNRREVEERVIRKRGNQGTLKKRGGIGRENRIEQTEGLKSTRGNVGIEKETLDDGGRVKIKGKRV